MRQQSYTKCAPPSGQRLRQQLDVVLGYDVRQSDKLDTHVHTYECWYKPTQSVYLNVVDFDRQLDGITGARYTHHFVTEKFGNTHAYLSATRTLHKVRTCGSSTSTRNLTSSWSMTRLPFAEVSRLLKRTRVVSIYQLFDKDTHAHTRQCHEQTNTKCAPAGQRLRLEHNMKHTRMHTHT